MKTKGHYVGLHVEALTRLEKKLGQPTEEHPEGEPYEEQVPTGELTDPVEVCIPAKLVGEDTAGNAVIDVLDPTWPFGPQRRNDVPFGRHPVGGHSAFHLEDDH